MNRPFGRVLAALVALTIGVAVALTAGPATAATTSCSATNSKMYAPSSTYSYYRLHTSSYACYVGAERLGWYTYSMNHWRCGDFNCHSYWLRHR
jgi:hypothetical protein